MNLRNLIVPVVLVAGMAFVASDAMAAPVGSTPTSAMFGGRVTVGGGIGINVPIGGRRVAYPTQTVQSGYWTTVTEQVYVPGQLIGYDRYGNPIMTAGHYQTVQRQVWVPAPTRVVYPYRSGPVGTVHVGLGGRWRIR